MTNDCIFNIIHILYYFIIYISLLQSSVLTKDYIRHVFIATYIITITNELYIVIMIRTIIYVLMNMQKN